MRANPGGYISPDEVVGRNALIQRLWVVLERQSLVLSAERRMGKTCVVKKMIAEAPRDKLAIYRDLEKVHTPFEFSELLFREVEDYLSGLQRTAGRVRQWLSHLTGAEIGGVVRFPDAAAPHWKTLLTNTVEDLVEHQDRRVIFFWDEMPLMLHNIRQRNGEREAMEILDALRSLRQMHSDLRMVFTGSIGLHNVIRSLRRVGYANDPTNDMDTVDVPPLSLADAQELARRTLEGENIEADDVHTTTDAIAKAADCIPYFIHHVVDQMAQRGGMANSAAVIDILDTSLTDPQDRWHLGYYRERIETYYADLDKTFALHLLDILSAAAVPLRFDDLLNLLKSQLVTEDAERVRDVVALLQRDHYVVLGSDGRLRFRFPLIQRWWRLHRGLGA